MTKKQRQKLVGSVLGLAVLAVVGYYGYTYWKQQQQQEPETPPLPPPNVVPPQLKVPQPTGNAQRDLEEARTAYNAYVAYLQTYPPISEPDVAAAQSHLEKLRSVLRSAAARVGVKVNV